MAKLSFPVMFHRNLFGICLLAALLTTTYILYQTIFSKQQQDAKKSWPSASSLNDVNLMKTIAAGGIIVDLNCLDRLKSGKKCDYPVRIAVNATQTAIGKDVKNPKYFSSDILIVEFGFEDFRSKNYLLFRNMKNGENADLHAVRRFNLKKASLRMQNETLLELHVPEDPTKFIRNWKNGKFFECQPILKREENVERTIPLAFLDRMTQFSDLIEENNATPFILGGTLLGWRRECSLIPHTMDIDFAVFREDHSDSLLRAILTSTTFVIHWVIGRLRNSFELTVNVDGMRVDLFYVYSTHNSSFVGGMRYSARQRLTWNYPKLSKEICAGDLLGYLFHIPCDFDKVIQADYGIEEWKEDQHTRNYVWDKSHKNKKSEEIYTAEEWPYVYLLVENKAERFVPAIVDQWIRDINKSA